VIPTPKNQMNYDDLYDEEVGGAGPHPGSSLLRGTAKFNDDEDTFMSCAGAGFQALFGALIHFFKAIKVGFVKAFDCLLAGLKSLLLFLLAALSACYHLLFYVLSSPFVILWDRIKRKPYVPLPDEIVNDIYNEHKAEEVREEIRRGTRGNMRRIRRPDGPLHVSNIILACDNYVFDTVANFGDVFSLKNRLRALAERDGIIFYNADDEVVRTISADQVNAAQINREVNRAVQFVMSQDQLQESFEIRREQYMEIWALHIYNVESRTLSARERWVWTWGFRIRKFLGWSLHYPAR